MSGLKDDSPVSEYETPIHIFHFYFDLIFRQFNFLPMPECLNSFHLSKETNFHNYKIKHGGPSLVTAHFTPPSPSPGMKMPLLVELTYFFLLTYFYCVPAEEEARHRLNTR